MEGSGAFHIHSIPRLLAAVLFCIIVGSLGSIVTVSGPGTWYATLEKPFFSPPNWVFGPVWITLFTLMGIALYLVWDAGTSNRHVQIALVIFGIQFALNVLWSFLFFGKQSPYLGLLDIVLLWILIVLTMYQFAKINTWAAILLVPYIAWVTLATALNYAIYVLNP